MKVVGPHLSTEAMSAYVDGELGDGPRQRAAAHIQTCFECAYAVGVQQQAKDSLTGGGDDVPVPRSLLSRLGEIPFSADLEAGSLDEVGLYADERGQFEFRVAAPADPQKSARTGFGFRRGRTFRSSAAAVALLSVAAAPLAAHPGNNSPRGHQMTVGAVVHRAVVTDADRPH